MVRHYEVTVQPPLFLLLLNYLAWQFCDPSFFDGKPWREVAYYCYLIFICLSYLVSTDIHAELPTLNLDASSARYKVGTSLHLPH